MPTKNPRIHVTFEEATVEILTNLAPKQRKSVASLVRELTLEALERREDLYLSRIAEELDKEDAKKYTHNDAWK